MGVMMQAFYWDCPREDKKEYQNTDIDGRAQLFAAPRGYAVYVVK